MRDDKKRVPPALRGMRIVKDALDFYLLGNEDIY